ncbi:MAG: AAA family ATPase [Nitrospira sp.]|nr:AAA family ATPase [Nitrospira sp.]
MGAIIYGIERRKGFVAIYGEVGVGKTTIIRAYLEKTSDRKQKTVYILNPVLSFHGLLTDIFRSLDLVPSNDDSAEMVNQLQEALIQEYRSDSTVVLVIDEAQNMPVKTLEQLRLLSNLETSTDKLIQIVLIGQPELITLLNHPTLKSLNQRIALRATIQPLQPKESQAYIEHRVALSSSTGTPLFTQGAMKLIVREAQGIPRRINILCDNALITGYGRQQKPVSISEVREILADMDGSHSSSLVKWAVGIAVVILLAIGVFLLSPIFLPGDPGVSQVSLSERERQNVKPVPSEKMPQESTGQLEGQAMPMTSSGSEIDRPTPPSVRGRVGGLMERTVEKVIDTSMSDGKLRDHTEVASKPIQSSPVTRSVKEGDNLSQIANEAYGSSSRQYVEWLRRHNPQISDPDIILPGQKIVLPEYVKE